MLHEFLAQNRNEIIARSRVKVSERMAPRPTEVELRNGVPLFLDQLIVNLRRSPSGDEEIGRGAALHASELLRIGLTVAQVVHDYGDICQAVTELATEQEAPISADEFHTLNRCLDEAIAHAVTEYLRQRERSVSEEGTERMAVLAHELRNQLSSALLAFEALKSGKVAIGGSTGALLGRSLQGLSSLITRSLAEVRLEAGSQLRGRILMAEFIEEIEVAAAMEAKARGLQLTVAPVEYLLAAEADRLALGAAVANLLHNAFKFTRPAGHVSLVTRGTADRVLIEVEDECGGLPPGQAEDLFRPYEQRGTDRTGLGLGLAISRRGVQASGGDIRVRSVPGRGCIFTIEVPRLPVPAPAA